MADRAARRRQLRGKPDTELDLAWTARIGAQPTWEADPEELVVALNDFAAWFDPWLKAEAGRKPSTILMASHNWHALAVQTLIASLGFTGEPAAAMWDMAATTMHRRAEMERQKLPGRRPRV